MHSDTVIGIVGAVVLVSVMVGVFAYEYNNADVAEPELEGDALAMHTFNDTYPNLAAAGDIDADGIANFADDDLDGDGILNADDDDIKFEPTVSGATSAGVSSPASTPASQAWTFSAEDGILHIVFTVSHAERAVNDQTLLPLSVQLTRPDGSTQPVTITTNGGTTTYVADMGAEAVAGDYQITVGPGVLGPGGIGVDPGTQYSVAATFHYEAGDPAASHEH